MRNKIKLIYNPHSGKKRSLLTRTPQTSLEEVKALLKQYQIPVDYFPTRGPNHAYTLAKNSKKEKYEMVIVAGGDGTVGQVANGLVGTDIILGVLPLGSVMNVARMLAIPRDIEKAVAMIKIRRVRKIDVGCITRLAGEKLADPYYFLESIGLGIEAQIHQHFVTVEEGGKMGMLRIIKTLIDYYVHRPTLVIDGKEFKTKASQISISNGPYTGAALRLAPEAKLNDHRLTVSIFKMSRYEFYRFFYHLFRNEPYTSKKIETYQAKKVKILTRKPRLLHADARVFGTTPVEITVLPNALNVITGFPTEDEASLQKRTVLDP